MVDQAVQVLGQLQVGQTEVDPHVEQEARVHSGLPAALDRGAQKLDRLGGLVELEELAPEEGLERGAGLRLGGWRREPALQLPPARPAVEGIGAGADLRADRGELGGDSPGRCRQRPGGVLVRRRRVAATGDAHHRQRQARATRGPSHLC